MPQHLRLVFRNGTSHGGEDQSDDYRNRSGEMWLAVRWFRPRRGTEWQNQAPRLGWRASTTSSIIGPRRRIRFDRFGTAAPRARWAPHEPEPEPEARLDGHQRSASDPPSNRSGSPRRARRGSARSPCRGRAVEHARGCRPERTGRERRRLNETSAAPPFRAGRRSGISTLPWMGRRCAVKPARPTASWLPAGGHQDRMRCTGAPQQDRPSSRRFGGSKPIRLLSLRRRSGFAEGESALGVEGKAVRT